MRLLATAKADGDGEAAAFLNETHRDELGEGIVLITRALGEDLVETVTRLRASGLSVVVVAVAAHTYRGTRGGRLAAREAAFSGAARRLELAGAAVRIVRREGGVAALAGDRHATGAR
jgi:vacuolar-type H+-ATPase subunit F/Vma7